MMEPISIKVNDPRPKVEQIGAMLAMYGATSWEIVVFVEIVKQRAESSVAGFLDLLEPSAHEVIKYLTEKQTVLDWYEKKPLKHAYDAIYGRLL